MAKAEWWRKWKSTFSLNSVRLIFLAGFWRDFPSEVSSLEQFGMTCIPVVISGGRGFQPIGLCNLDIVNAATSPLFIHSAMLIRMIWTN